MPEQSHFFNRGYARFPRRCHRKQGQWHRNYLPGSGSDPRERRARARGGYPRSRAQHGGSQCRERNALPTQFYVGASEYLGGQSNAKAILAEAEKRGIAVQRAVCPIQELGHSGLEARFAGFSSILEERGIAVTVYNRGVVLQVGISLDGEGSNSAKIRVGSLNP